MQVDDLFTKIGILTMENDMLRAQLNAANERIKELEAKPLEKPAAKDAAKE